MWSHNKKQVIDLKGTLLAYWHLARASEVYTLHAALGYRAHKQGQLLDLDLGTQKHMFTVVMHVHMHILDMHICTCTCNAQLIIMHTHARSHMHTHVLDTHVGLHALYVDVHSDEVLQHA